MRYDPETINQIRQLRAEGCTFPEIQARMQMHIPKGSLSYLCKGIELTSRQKARISHIIGASSAIGRAHAKIANKIRFDIQLMECRVKHEGLSEFMQSRNAKMVALAMLYLGEGGKRYSYGGSRHLSLGSTSLQIIRLYMSLLKDCYDIPIERFRGRIHHRADQDPESLLDYWSEATGLTKQQFYTPYIDKRTIGKPTLKTDYKGVCTISCSGASIQLELSQIAGIIFESFRGL